MKSILNLLIIVCSALLCYACSGSSNTEKHQNKRDNVINIRDKVKEIDIKDVMIGHAATFIINDYLIIADISSSAELIHVFDKNTFEYISSRVFKGRGPGEIINIGHIATDETNGAIYITDHGKHNIFRYDLDSLLADSRYMPIAKMKTKERQFPMRYQYINDTLSIGVVMKVDDRGYFETLGAKWNMNTGEIKFMKYQHPDIKKKRIDFAVSTEKGIYVECYLYHDLMTICSFDGDLKYNIYGRNWNTRVTNEVRHFGKVSFYEDKIVALYSGENRHELDENEKLRGNYATKFIVFDLNGDYIKTLETGCQISSFSFDKENNRFILDLQREIIQFAYLDLDGLID